jgi:hypothetical protein
MLNGNLTTEGAEDLKPADLLLATTERSKKETPHRLDLLQTKLLQGDLSDAKREELERLIRRARWWGLI